jgi:hypothetical protein
MNARIFPAPMPLTSFNNASKNQKNVVRVGGDPAGEPLPHKTNPATFRKREMKRESFLPIWLSWL